MKKRITTSASTGGIDYRQQWRVEQSFKAGGREGREGGVDEVVGALEASESQRSRCLGYRLEELIRDEA